LGNNVFRLDISWLVLQIHLNTKHGKLNLGFVFITAHQVYSRQLYFYILWWKFHRNWYNKFHYYFL